MSLIHDAMKVAQRERAGRSSTDKSPQVIDGFFPYVSSSSTRAGSRRALIAGFSAAAVVLIAITAWVAWPKNTKAPIPGRTPIVLPPRVTTATNSPAPDTAAVQALGADPKAVVVQTQTDAVAEPDRTNLVAGSQSRAPQSGSGSTRQPTQGTIVAADPPERQEPTPAAQIRAVTPRIDYEGQATVLFNAGDLAGAREKFQLATRDAPNARAWTNYGVTLQRLGDLTGAAAAYQSAIGLDGTYLEAWLYQGRLAAEQGDVARAIPLFQRARAINPRNADVNVELARLEYDSKNWSEAKRFAEEALRGDPANIRAFWFLAVASDPLKDADGSIRGYSGFLQYVGDAPDQAQFVGWARTRLAQLRVKP